jgi:hypothetical protein
VQASIGDSPFMYTSSISESAAVGFSRLGWQGDHRYPMMVALPCVVAPTGWFRRKSIEVRSSDVSAECPIPAEVSSDIDLVWNSLDDRPVAMVRDAAHLRQHMKLAGVEQGRITYRLLIAYKSGTAIGWMLVRVTARSSIRSLRGARVGMVSDFATPARRPDVLRALTQAASRYFVSRAEIILTTAGQECDLRVFDGLGFVSPRTPILGRKLAARMATRTMYLPPNEEASSLMGPMHLTFADNDTDFILSAPGDKP